MINQRMILIPLLMASVVLGQPTEIQYLSGTGSDDTMPWEFFCTEGRRSGQWATIQVPSNWELQGFGTYNYGHDKNKAKEEGHYKTTFSCPDSWQNKTINLVFEGVMTDTLVKVNGQVAGPKHQGGFYRFSL
jgi:hypothetical protein